MRAYLDHNASMPLRREAREAMLAALDVAANPSSVHAEGRFARRLVEDARRAVARLAGGNLAHVVFTSGASEAASWLATPDWMMGRATLKFSRFYVGATEHACLLRGHRFAAEDIEVLPVTADGVIDIAALEMALASHDRVTGLPLVAVQAANNETGVIQPIARISAIVRAAGGMLIVDAAQAGGRLPLDLSGGAWGDFLILSAHKMGGPKGVGAIVSASDLMMPRPLIAGGGQERGHRGGTENLAGIAGFGAAAEAAMGDLTGVEAMLAGRTAVEAEIFSSFPDAVIFGADAPRLPNTVMFAVPGLKAETAQIAFDLEGIAVSAGSACSSGKVGPSHVLAAMGHQNEGGIRISFGQETSDADFAVLSQALETVAGRLGARRRAA